MHKALMHKTRFIWLKNPWNLTESQPRRLGELEQLNLKINRAYLLKELFAHFWTYRRAGWATRHLKCWCWWFSRMHACHRCETSPGGSAATSRTSLTISACPSTTVPSKA